jgi:hypothetical protein
MQGSCRRIFPAKNKLKRSAARPASCTVMPKLATAFSVDVGIVGVVIVFSASRFCSSSTPPPRPGRSLACTWSAPFGQPLHRSLTRFGHVLDLELARITRAAYSRQLVIASYASLLTLSCLLCVTFDLKVLVMYYVLRRIFRTRNPSFSCQRPLRPRAARPEKSARPDGAQALRQADATARLDPRTLPGALA